MKSWLSMELCAVTGLWRNDYSIEDSQSDKLQECDRNLEGEMKFKGVDSWSQLCPQRLHLDFNTFALFRFSGLSIKLAHIPQCYAGVWTECLLTFRRLQVQLCNHLAIVTSLKFSYG